jgi:hypothetical protein
MRGLKSYEPAAWIGHRRIRGTSGTATNEVGRPSPIRRIVCTNSS